MPGVAPCDVCVQACCQRVLGWEADCVGLLHREQDPGDPTQVCLGHDCCLLTKWELRGLWWHGQHAHHI